MIHYVTDNNTTTTAAISNIRSDIVGLTNRIDTADTNISNNATAIANNKTATDAAIMDLQSQIDNL